MTSEEVHKMSMLDKVRKIKVLTPDEYALHCWIDGCQQNGLLIDTLFLHLAAGGKVWRAQAAKDKAS